MNGFVSRNILIGVVILCVVVVSTIFLVRANLPSQPSQNPQKSGPTNDTTQIRLEQKIKFTDMGFEPKFVSIKAGTTVVWTNESINEISLNSDDHPTHKKYPPLNLGEFEKDRSVEMMFETPGTYTYHNHFNPQQTGIIEVQ